MSKKQLKQAHVLRSCNERLMSRRDASQTLGLCERRISRRAKEMKELGESSLIRKNTGRKPSRALSGAAAEQIPAPQRNEICQDCFSAF
ncbi:MAG: hypothetical protein LBU32_31600 [Clostridiales bacterium]|nr:hypothetical protein [Clostridiales bacterium]